MSQPDPSTVPAEHLRRNRSFTRRGSRVPERQERILAEHGPAYVLQVPMLSEASTLVRPDVGVDVAAAFGRTAPVVVDIGSGTGDSTVAAAQEDPDRDYLAVEVWLPGVAQTVTRAAELGLSNLKVLTADAAQALPELFGPGDLDEVWTFFPDPWPKARHHKRRLVQGPFADEVARLLRPGGVWRLATDWADYAWQLRDVVEACPGLVNPYAGRLAYPGDAQEDPRGDHGGFAPRFERRVTTRFERKGERAERLVRDVVGERTDQ